MGLPRWRPDLATLRLTRPDPHPEVPPSSEREEVPVAVAQLPAPGEDVHLVQVKGGAGAAGVVRVHQAGGLAAVVLWEGGGEGERIAQPISPACI